MFINGPLKLLFFTMYLINKYNITPTLLSNFKDLFMNCKNVIIDVYFLFYSILESRNINMSLNIFEGGWYEYSFIHAHIPSNWKYRKEI